MAFVEDTKDWCFSFAPGRIEFLGNHLDYNGGDVLGMAVNAGIYCLGVPDSENKLDGNTKKQESIFFSVKILKMLLGKDNLTISNGKTENLHGPIIAWAC